MHTPEPWVCGDSDRPGVMDRLIFGNQFSEYHSNVRIRVAEATMDSALPRDVEPAEIANANARRIVACVNVLVGIPTEVLEDPKTAELIRHALKV